MLKPLISVVLESSFIHSYFHIFHDPPLSIRQVVGDQSDYVTVVNQVLTHGATTGGRKLGENDCRYDPFL